MSLAFDYFEIRQDVSISAVSHNSPSPNESGFHFLFYRFLFRQPSYPCPIIARSLYHSFIHSFPSMASAAKRFGRLSGLNIRNQSPQNRFLAAKLKPRTFPLGRTMSTNSEPEVIMEAKNSIEMISLNRPKALNALSLNMVRVMQPQLEKWKGEGIKMIIVKGDIKV